MRRVESLAAARILGGRSGNPSNISSCYFHFPYADFVFVTSSSCRHEAGARVFIASSFGGSASHRLRSLHCHDALLESGDVASLCVCA